MERVQRLVWVGLLAWMAMGMPLQGQRSAQDKAADGAQAAPDAGAAPSFEVSAVKVSKADESGSNSMLKDGRFTASNTTLKTLIAYQGYSVPASRILGGPKWLETQRFDMDAKMDEEAATRLLALPPEERRKQTLAMFQKFLADRFKLAVHWESRELPVYALVLSKKGSALRKTTEPEGQTGSSAGNGTLKTTGQTLPQLADTLTRELARELGRPVIDKTGVTGRYDFELKWTPAEGERPLADEKGMDGIADAGTSIFTAMQEQMGLKLESAKSAVPVLVIDHAEMPAEN
jgi:uncharacterized protein (TIGR03435 family)